MAVTGLLGCGAMHRGLNKLFGLACKSQPLKPVEQQIDKSKLTLPPSLHTCYSHSHGNSLLASLFIYCCHCSCFDFADR